ncbi:MAG TPA: DUF5677 domain-containing protein [Acetobacteraceae bacterium]|jgi:hypothetical protein|nr:DUF5677 domain-containing protein [Acetobacteraceae bacterium]
MTTPNIWFDFAERAAEMLAKFQTVYVPLHGPKSSKVRMTGLALAGRTLSNFRGVLLLARAGLAVEARTLTRSCLENFYFLSNLITDGESFVDKMSEHDASRRNARGQFILE